MGCACGGDGCITIAGRVRAVARARAAAVARAAARLMGVCSVGAARAGVDAGAAVRNPGGIAAEPSGASLVAIAPRSPAGSHFLYLGQLAR